MASEIEQATTTAAAATPAGALPREMERHTYRVMREVEDSHWWFAGRRLILESFVGRIVSESGLPPGARARILDVGCGTGANLEMLARFGDAEGVDISEDALRFCRARGLTRVRAGAAESLPYADAQFDLVTALDVVEHLDDDRAGLREMRRVLRPSGRALLFVPAFMWLWGVQDDVSNHRRRYTVPGLRAAVEGAGLSVERATYANVTFFAPILAGRALMRATGVRPASENNVNVPALNGLFGRLFGAERHWLGRFNLPFGVSAVCVARRVG
ncbi:MAG: class I SAM-dependent methyltransferase [Acidobacteria bacterium]|nr:class I SAM-dependent methyltransferase [Acidobacteriota bacterium]